MRSPATLPFAALALLGALACNRAERRDTGSGDATGAAMSASDTVATAATATKASLDDPTIVAIFDAANTYDIETSQLALQKSKNPRVRRLARQFMNDHTNVRQQGRDLAKRLGVTPTPPQEFALTEDHTKAMETLQGKSGADFDKAFIAHEVDYHQAVIDAINQQLLPSIQNAELKALVQQVAPAFQGHLEAAKQLQKNLGPVT
jgi:putative membrane protein